MHQGAQLKCALLNTVVLECRPIFSISPVLSDKAPRVRKRRRNLEIPCPPTPHGFIFRASIIAWGGARSSARYRVWAELVNSIPHHVIVTRYAGFVSKFGNQRLYSAMVSAVTPTLHSFHCEVSVSLGLSSGVSE